MKNIMKITLALLTSVSLVTSATAGELTVTGTAKATYNMLSGGTLSASTGQAKALGITNEIDFGANGELDNGMTWKYQFQFDPGATTNNGGVDDTRLELSSASYGTVGFYVGEGGLDVDNGGSQSVYGRPTDIGLSSGITDGPGIDGFNNVQFHTPAGLLPFDVVIKAAHAPNNQTALASGNAKGAAIGDGLVRFVGKSTSQFQIKGSPVDGINLGADYYQRHDQGNVVETVVQKNEAGSVFATYTMGAASFGLSRTMVAPLILGTSATASAISNTGTSEGNTSSARLYTNTKGSVAYNVNDNLSISYEQEKSNREVIAQTDENDIKAQAVQAAYTMGGMTLSLSVGSTDNVGYTKDNDINQTLFAMSMAF